MTEDRECKSLTVEFDNGNPNPTIKIFCPFYEKITKMENDISWLKKGYWLQALLGVGTFITVITLILRLLGVI